jgi:stage IV sporulation protein FB
MYAPVATTPFDLRFRLFGVPVTVTPWFWALGVFLAWGEVTERHFDLLLIWLACVFVSILVHEYGHAFLAEFFGCWPSIYLYQFGGLAVFQPNSRFSTWRSIAVSFAGPAAGFVLCGLIFVMWLLVDWTGWLDTLSPTTQERVDYFFDRMLWINIAWGILNLMPILPLDGGRIAEALLIRFRRRDGQRWAFILGAVVAGGIAAFFGLLHESYNAILFGFLCITNVQSLQRRNPW